MSDEKKEPGECRVTVQVDGCEACCGKDVGDLKPDGGQRVVRVVCCPGESKKEQ
jgi:hypothetical protein